MQIDVQTNGATSIFCTVILVIAAVLAVKAQATKKSEINVLTQSQKTMIGDNSINSGLKSGTGDGARAVDGPAAIVGALITVDLSTVFILFCVASIVAGNNGAKVDPKVGALYVFVSVAGAGLSIWGFTNAIGDSIAKAGVVSLDAARYLANDIALAGAGAGFVFMLFGSYLGKRAIEKEEPSFLFLRHSGVELNALRSTKFAYATLNNCDFSNVDLKHVRLKKARFQGCKFVGAKNTHLASTRNTALEFKKVRDLVIDRIPFPDNKFEDLNMEGKILNLQGMDFSHLDLHNVDFANANISFADFNYCDLRNADLSEVNAIGTCFNNCQMTGACVEHWNIDSRTTFNGIKCDFVYINVHPKVRHPAKGEFIRNTPANEEDKFDRNPPEGVFGPDEFSKIYRQVAGTIDFIVQNHTELRALVNAVNTIKVEAGNEEISVQGFDFTEDTIIVKLKAPPQLREQIYKEVKNEFQHELLLLQNNNVKLKNKIKSLEVNYLKKEVELHSNSLRMVANIANIANSGRLPNNIYIRNQTVNDQSIHAPITQSAINNGNNSTITNHVEQCPESYKELKAVLLELQKILTQSNLPAADKQQAELTINELAKVSQQPESERKSLTLFSLASLEKLQSLGELGARYGELLTKVASWF